ncbi:hypothetical protein RSAG8_11058, partial [Rhizoctonia solani AG-8 WAC10335]
MPSDQNLPVVPKRRPRRAAAAVAAGRLSSVFTQQVLEETQSPPRKRHRPLRVRNDSSDFEESKSNPIIVDSSPVRVQSRVMPTPAGSQSSTSHKPRTAPVIMEVLLSRSARVPPRTATPRVTTSATPSTLPAPASKPAGSTQKDPKPQNTKPNVFKSSVSQPSSSKSAQLKTRYVRVSETNQEIDYITGDSMVRIWKDGIDRNAYKYSQELAKNL